MKCPYCNYKHGFINGKHIEGRYGEFYRLSNEVRMARERDYDLIFGKETVYACPKCGKVFIDV